LIHEGGITSAGGRKQLSIRGSPNDQLPKPSPNLDVIRPEFGDAIDIADSDRRILGRARGANGLLIECSRRRRWIARRNRASARGNGERESYCESRPDKRTVRSSRPRAH
jgi:hypothetical protein